jgi:hypothetical protein
VTGSRESWWRRAWRAAKWYVAEFFGDNAYEKYLVRHELAHARLGGAEPAAHRPMSRREFYRRLTDSTPPKGCC